MLCINLAAAQVLCNKSGPSGSWGLGEGLKRRAIYFQGT